MYFSIRIPLIIVACLSIAASAQGDIVISDQTFDSADWSTTFYSLSGSASSTVSQQTSGGNPDGYRRMTHTLVGISNIGVFHAYLPETYNPSASGAIQSLDYSQDQAQFFPPFQGAAIGSTPALRQDGIIYFGPSLEYTNLSWQTATLSDLTASDFSNAGLNPDFGATGSVIEFGYGRSNSNTGAGIYSTVHGIDNWSYTITQVPEPSSCGLLIGSLVAIGARRRRKI